MCDPEERELELGARTMSRGCRAPYGLACGAAALHGAPACRSRPRTCKLPGGRVRKAAASPALEAAAAPAKDTGRRTRCEALGPEVEKWTGSRGVLSQAQAARAQALSACRDCGRGPRPPRGARSAPGGKARARLEDPAKSAGRRRGGTLHFNSP